jgi:hypothetical protein
VQTCDDDVYLSGLPDREDLERLDRLLADMLIKTDAEVERVAGRGEPDAVASP